MSLLLEHMAHGDCPGFSHTASQNLPWMDGWTGGWADIPCISSDHHSLCVWFQAVICCWKWRSQWTRLGTGGSGELEEASSTLPPNPHHCCPQSRGSRATTWRSSGSCSPTTACSTKTGQRSPGDIPAIESARPSTPSSPSCPRTSWSSFTGTRARPNSTHPNRVSATQRTQMLPSGPPVLDYPNACTWKRLVIHSFIHYLSDFTLC